jgi:hypothetical protein
LVGLICRPFDVARLKSIIVVKRMLSHHHPRRACSVNEERAENEQGSIVDDFPDGSECGRLTIASLLPNQRRKRRSRTKKAVFEIPFANSELTPWRARDKLAKNWVRIMVRCSWKSHVTY